MRLADVISADVPEEKRPLTIVEAGWHIKVRRIPAPVTDFQRNIIDSDEKTGL